MKRQFQRRELAATAVTHKGVNVSLVYRTFGVSETCYRYIQKINHEIEEIGDLLIGLTQSLRSWGVALCFLYRRNVKGECRNH